MAAAVAAPSAQQNTGRSDTAVGPVSITPNAQIKQQATKLVGAAYKPAFGDLAAEAKQAAGLAQKRADDSTYYSQWLATQNQQLLATNQANDAHLQGLEQGLISQQNSLYGGQAASMTNAAQNRVGNVSNESQNNDFGTNPSAPGLTQLGQNQAANEGLLTGTATWSDGLQQSMNNALTAGAANNQGIVAAAGVTNASDLQSTLQKIDTSREDLSGKEGTAITDTEDKIADNNLKGQEYNATYGLTQAKTASTIANQNSEIQNRQYTQGLDTQKLSLAQQVAQWHQQDSTRTYNLDVSKYQLDVQKEILAREKATGKIKPALSAASQNAVYNRIDSMTAAINEAMSQGGKTPAQALALVEGGGKIATAVGKTATGATRYEYQTIKGYGNDSTLQIAYALSQAGAGKLSSQQVRLLNAMGLTGVLQHYSLAQASANPNVGGTSNLGRP